MTMIELEYFQGVCDHAPHTLTREVLRQLVSQPQTRHLVEKCRQTGDQEQKKKLPAVTWQATYPKGTRADAGAKPTGLFMLDVDHISQKHPLSEVREAEDPARAMWEMMKPRVDELDIVCVHKTASGDGLRVVALCQPQFQTIAENQAWLATELNTCYDSVCKDWARLSFLSVPEDFYYIDNDTLFES